MASDLLCTHKYSLLEAELIAEGLDAFLPYPITLFTVIVIVSTAWNTVKREDLSRYKIKR
jgi:hypothetical protein